jgi:hypothetical protein
MGQWPVKRRSLVEDAVMSKRSSTFQHQVLVDCCDHYARLLFIYSLVNDFNQVLQFLYLQDASEAGENTFLNDLPQFPKVT